MASVNAYTLRAPGLELPDIRDGQTNAAQHGGTCFCNLESRRKYRIGPSDGDGVGRRPLAPAHDLANAHHLFECRCHAVILHAMFTPLCRGYAQRSTPA